MQGVPVNPALLLGFLALSALLSSVPGPSVLLGTSQAIVHGRSSAMWIVLGNAGGGLVLVGLVVTGLGALVTASAQMFFVLKISGALYLLWLGIRSIRTVRSDSNTDLDGHTGSVQRSRRRLMRQGFLVGVGNPKSIVSVMAILPQFVDRSLGHMPLQMVIIGLAGAVTQVLIETVWVTAAAAMRSWFQRVPRRIQTLRRAGGVAMIGLAGKLAFQR